MHFVYDDFRVNILDTPGHQDFSEDTYRTLVAADSAVMLIDAAKGVETQTRKLFEVCRLRGIPIFTFVNKMDRDGRDPFDLVGEIEEVLGIGVCRSTGRSGMGRDFRGVYDRLGQRLQLFWTARGARASSTRPVASTVGTTPEDRSVRALGAKADEARGVAAHCSGRGAPDDPARVRA